MILIALNSNMNLRITSQRNVTILLNRHLLADRASNARYATYQNVYLCSLKKAEHLAYVDLLKEGSGINITGESFSMFSGDLIWKLFIKQVKETAGSLNVNFSPGTVLVITWMENQSHTLSPEESSVWHSSYWNTVKTQRSQKYWQITSSSTCY